MLKQEYDLIIVGGGIIGLSNAITAVQKGKKVLLLERDEKAYGASIRNFGLVWPVGQPAGPLFDRTMKSREKWIEMADKAGFWCRPNGSLHLAYEDDELEVLQEYARDFNDTVQLLSPDQVSEYSDYVRLEGLKGALWSDTELSVNAKKAIYALSEWLSQQENATLKFYEQVDHVESGCVYTTNGNYHADRILVCSGHEFRILFPEIFKESGIIQSKLQMMRTTPIADINFGPTLCGGLTLTHYASFAQCPSVSKLKARIEEQMPEYVNWGIHVMINQNDDHELVIGDSHEYGLGFDPFDRADVNDLILAYLRRFLDMDELRIKESWHGIYSKIPGRTEFVDDPLEGVRIITGLSGAGMTFSFGLADQQQSWYS